MKICFLGIGGVSMAKLAAYLKSVGFSVYGQDRVESDATRALNRQGISVYIGENFCGVKNADIVVYSSAISENSYEIKVADSLKIPIIKRAELLGAVLRGFSKSIGVAGSHGKTTTSKMIKTVLDCANLNCLEHVGAFDGEFQPAFEIKPEYAVSEVCEYKKNISYITINTAVVLNVDNDHLDSYDSFSDLKSAFFDYLSRAKHKIVNLDDGALKEYVDKKEGGNRVYSYAIYSPADYVAKNLTDSGGAYSFDVYKRGVRFLKIKLSAYGLHNVYNALAAIAALDVNGVDKQKIKEGVESFAGVTRRFESLGELNGIKVIADYAHHPTEISATIKTMEEIYGNDFAVVFQPHTYSRTKILFFDFLTALKGITLAVYKTYAARESYDALGDGARLAKSLNAEYLETANDLTAYILKQNKKAALIMGAGDIYDVARKAIKTEKLK